MISFRYHLVTIVAVFLALGLGVLVGTTVVRPSVITELDRRVDDALASADRLREDLTEANADLRGWDEFGQAAQRLLVAGTLDGREVLLVTEDGVDVGQLDAVQTALRDAGAEVAGVLVATEQLTMPDERARSALAQVMGLPPSTPAADLSRQAASRLGARLDDGPPVLDPSLDILRGLTSAGFIEDQIASGGLDAVGGNDQPVVVLTGGRSETAPAPETFFLPLLTALVQAIHPVAVGEGLDAPVPVVPRIRDDATLDGRVVTVDNADSLPGRVALVLGLEGLLDGSLGSCDDFGVKAGACGILPQPPPAS
jgi:hypothetical protein